MLTISKPLSAGQARSYHQEEFSNAQENYYSEGDRIRGEWHGKLAEKWGLRGGVQEEQFRRLSDGQHPVSGEQLVRHQTAREYVDEQGKTVKAMEHRAGWDATFSAPKSVSLTALVGCDERVQEAHRASVGVALDEMERYVQARLGGNLPPETTGNWVAAKFEHDSARPVNGYAAPQLHTHVVFFNLTETANGGIRPLQPQELYRTQQYATAVYRSELAHRLEELGYEVEHGKSGQPEIKGYSRDYLEASSPRRKQINAHLAMENQSGAAAAQIAAHHTREAKIGLSHEEMQQRHKDMAIEFGDQPEHVKVGAKERVRDAGHEVGKKIAHSAVTFTKERNFERDAVADERTLLTDALRRSMGGATLAQVKADFEERVKAGEFVEVKRQGNSPDRAFTTTEMIGYERDTIDAMRAGQDRHAALATFSTRWAMREAHGHLSDTQRRAVEQILSSRDQVTALEGVAGAGKTTSLAAIREAAEREKYIVKGLAPTSRAAQRLGESGIRSNTLQRHLAQTHEGYDERKRLYILDESSLASTRQMNEFLRRLQKDDRVLLVGDTRQHQAIEAGKPYQQLQEAGIQTARLDEIVRQRDPALKEVVEKLSRGQVREAIEKLDASGRVHEIFDRDERIWTIAHEYKKQPNGTLVVSPDNQSREAINEAIHYDMQDTRRTPYLEYRMKVLVTRQEITGADRQWAAQYESGNVVRYAKGSKTLGIAPGEYARVESIDEKQNHVTVERGNGERLAYDPRRLQGVTLYKEAERRFSEGDRIQFTAPNRDQHVANRELGTIEKINESGHLRVRLDSGRAIAFNIRDNPHLDHGYAVTSHSSQGQTADRVLIHVDTEQGGEKLVNRRLAYVAVSRGRYDAQIYTNDKTALAEGLGREVSHRSALESTRAAEPRAAQKSELTSSPTLERERTIGRDFSPGR
ncbi:MAG: MobF family relaxase [Candidatus Acidiferrum sp.]